MSASKGFVGVSALWSGLEKITFCRIHFLQNTQEQEVYCEEWQLYGLERIVGKVVGGVVNSGQGWGRCVEAAAGDRWSKGDHLGGVSR